MRVSLVLAGRVRKLEGNLNGTPGIVSCRGVALDVADGRNLLVDVDLDVGVGETVALMGPSGSGKTSLLHCVAGLRPATRGTVRSCGVDLGELTASQRAKYRLNSVGTVLQFGELLPELTVGENVELPLLLAGSPSAERVADALDAVELGGAQGRWPAELSGGETQRVAIARAIVGGPQLVLADEPTGALDEDLGRSITALLVGLTKSQGAGLILATHNSDVASLADRVLRIKHHTVVEG